MRNREIITSKLKNAGAGWTLISLYMFFPMVFSASIPAPLLGSGSPIVEDRIAVKEIENREPGLGGPETVEEDEENIFTIESFETSDPALGRPLQLFITGGEEPKVYRINYFNTAGARLPVDPGAEISSDYGWRTPPCNGCSADHRGVDFVPGEGKPIYAVLDGMVIESGFLGGYGYWVMLEHLVKNPDTEEMERWETVYAHMQEGSIPEDVVIGAVVEKGDVIGKVGNTGMSTGPHLHFEIRIEGEEIDPLPLISSYEVVEVERDQEGNAEYRIRYE